MWYTEQHASTIMYTTARCRRAACLGSRVALVVWLYRSALPDAARERRRSAYHRDCPLVALQRPDCTQRHSRFREARTGRLATEIVAPTHHAGRVDRPRSRAAARAATSKPAHFRQAEQRLDPRTGRRGQLCPRHYLAPGQRRNHPQRTQAVGRVLEACQTLDYQPRSRLPQEKKRRDRLIRLATNHPTWALGFADEVWWSRLAQPDQHGWTDD